MTERMIPSQTWAEAVATIEAAMPPDNAGDLTERLALALNALGLISISDPPIWPAPGAKR